MTYSTLCWISHSTGRCALSLYIRLNLSWASLSQRQYIYDLLSASPVYQKGKGKSVVSKQKTTKQMALRHSWRWLAGKSRAHCHFWCRFSIYCSVLVLYFFWRQRRWSAQAGWQVCTGKSWQMQSQRQRFCSNAFTSLPAERCMANWLRHSKWQLICAFPEISEFKIAKMARLIWPRFVYVQRASFCILFISLTRNENCICNYLQLSSVSRKLHQSEIVRRGCISHLHSSVANDSC